jgi:hypothetical protein
VSSVQQTCARCRSFTTPPIVAAAGYDGSVCGSLGAAGPVELPCAREVARYSRRWTLPVRSLSSPVFLSTDEQGRVVQGLAGLPTSHMRPILFVGNHQVRACVPWVAPERGTRARRQAGGAPAAARQAPAMNGSGGARCQVPLRQRRGTSSASAE